MNDLTAEKPKVLVEAKFIQDLITQQKLVSLYLANGIRLQGYVIGYDKYTLLLKTNNGDKESTQLIYKHAISTVSSSHNSYTYSQARASDASNQTIKTPAEQKG